MSMHITIDPYCPKDRPLCVDLLNYEWRVVNIPTGSFKDLGEFVAALQDKNELKGERRLHLVPGTRHNELYAGLRYIGPQHPTQPENYLQHHGECYFKLAKLTLALDVQ